MANKARKQAPRVSVVDVYLDERAALLKQLESTDPENVYSYQDSKASQDSLMRLNQEVVKREDGSILTLGADIVVKTPKEVFEAMRAKEGERSFQTVKRIVKDPRSIKQVAKPVTPGKKEIDEELGD